jgi:hypothetical protein
MTAAARRTRDSYVPPAKQAVLPPPDGMPVETGLSLRTFPCVYRRTSAAEKHGVIHVVEVDERSGLPTVQAFLEIKGVAKPLSVSIDPIRARDLARRILAGEREVIRDFRTLNALAASICWLMRDDWDWSALRFKEDNHASDSDQMKLAMQAQRHLAEMEL